MRVFKNVISFLILSCVTLFIMIIASSVVQAENKSDKKVIYLGNGESTNNILFDNENPIAPGDKIVKEFYINNNHKFISSINSINIDGSLFDINGKIVDKDKAEYKDFLNNSLISLYCENEEVFRGSLEKLLNLDLSSDDTIKIDKNGSKKFTMEYEIPKSTGNSIMGMKYKFNITFGYSEVAAIVQTGQIVDFKALIMLGTLLFCIGLSLIYKKTTLSIKST